jgi:ATP-dependent RNA helicase RhlE
MLFSATMPDDVVKLVGDMLKEPLRIEVAPQSKPIERIEQHVVFADAKEKRQLLAHLLSDPDFKRVIVFTRTKHGANKVAEVLEKTGFTAEAIHGNKSQNARQRALARFRSGEAPILVATDIAARGIDIDDISHVINFELPNEPESYVHRIGRTARAGASGIAISLVDREERGLLKQIERVTRQSIKHMQVDGFVASSVPAHAPAAPSHAPAAPHGERREHQPARPGQHPRKAKQHRKGQNRPRPAGDAPRNDNRGGNHAPKKPQHAQHRQRTRAE